MESIGKTGNGVLRNKIQGSEDNDLLEPIAVIGFSFGFPQDATSSESFWDMMINKRGSVTAIPPDRFNAAAMYHPDASRKGQASLSSYLECKTELICKLLDRSSRCSFHQG